MKEVLLTEYQKTMKIIATQREHETVSFCKHGRKTQRMKMSSMI